MADDIRIGIAVDGDKAVRGVQDVEGALEDVSDALDDMARDTKRGGKDAERAIEDLQDTFSDTVKKAKDLGDAGDKAGDDVRRGMKRAEEGVRDFKDESNSTAREAAASFDGSAESISDAFQEIAANAFSGFGPVGAAAGLAAAAGIGLAAAGFENVAAAQEASEEAVAEWADKFIESGERVLSASQIAAMAQEIITDPEKWKTAQKNAELWGVSVETAVLAAAGHAPSLDTVNGSLDKQRQAFLDATEAGRLNMEQRDKELGRLGEATSAYETLTDGIVKGQAAANVYSQSLLNLIATTEDATVQTDELGNKVYELPGGKQIFVDAKTGQASENIEGFKGDLETVPKTVVTNATLNTSGATSSLDMWVRNNQGRVVRVDVLPRYGRAAV